MTLFYATCSLLSFALALSTSEGRSWAAIAHTAVFSILGLLFVLLAVLR